MCVEGEGSSAPPAISNRQPSTKDKVEVPYTLLLTPRIKRSTVERSEGFAVSVLSKQLEKKVNELIAQADAIRSEANRHIDEINKKIKRYNQALAAEYEDEDGQESSKPPPRISKMAFIRQHIESAGTTGTSYAGIAQALGEKGFPTNENYRYTVVSRWRKEGKILEREGRIYWADSLKP